MRVYNGTTTLENWRLLGKVTHIPSKWPSNAQVLSFFQLLLWFWTYFWTVVLEKTLESPSDSKEIKSVNPKGNQSWIFLGRTDAETEALILWPPDANSQLIRKDPDAGKEWRQEEKGTAEDVMVEWHFWFNGHELEQAPGDDERQQSLGCYRLWGHKMLDTTEWLNNNKI